MFRGLKRSSDIRPAEEAVWIFGGCRLLRKKGFSKMKEPIKTHPQVPLISVKLYGIKYEIGLLAIYILH